MLYRDSSRDTLDTLFGFWIMQQLYVIWRKILPSFIKISLQIFLFNINFKVLPNRARSPDRGILQNPLMAKWPKYAHWGNQISRTLSATLKENALVSSVFFTGIRLKFQEGFFFFFFLTCRFHVLPVCLVLHSFYNFSFSCLSVYAYRCISNLL